MRRRLLVFAGAALAVIAIAILLYATRRSWLWMPLNPRYTTAELRGKSEQEILSLFGKPYYVNPGGENGVPRTFLYTGAFGAGRAIEFDASGHVQLARDASK